MLEVTPATITSIVRADADVVEARALAGGEAAERRVIAYPALTGGIAVGDSVLLNITATALSLGTGGYDFVTANLSRPEAQVFGDPDGSEHVVKLRYTPYQHAVRAVEMIAEYATIWEGARGLRGVPVVVCELHSQVAAVCAGINARLSGARVVYVYTDTAALPIAFSKLVPKLKAAGLVDATITAGQAFGGDYEAVSFASALVAADWIAGADVIVVGQGPGNAGTGTRFGWSGIEQGSQLSQVGALGGDPLMVLRVSEREARARHDGVSHHSLTVLSTMTSCAVTIALPEEARWDNCDGGLSESRLAERHQFVDAASEPGLVLLAESGVAVTTMGRGVAEDGAFFAFAAAAGALAAERVATKRTPG